ncbi:hypothetical protein GCM10023189_43400 [Nibrella saemangeumensis]|uniref:Uncharacterized protein n=1 Tax=Nibrella saemangeumensis TaxID=1084526 RepID=A0ABP8NE30_9BACT
MYKFLTSVLAILFTNPIHSDREFAASEVMTAVLLMMASMLLVGLLL